MKYFDLENDDNFELTQLDIYRLEDLEINDEILGECGNFLVKRESTHYLLEIRHEGLIRKHKIIMKTFKSLISLIKFLKHD